MSLLLNCFKKIQTSLLSIITPITNYKTISYSQLNNAEKSKYMSSLFHNMQIYSPEQFNPKKINDETPKKEPKYYKIIFKEKPTFLPRLLHKSYRDNILLTNYKSISYNYIYDNETQNNNTNLNITFTDRNNLKTTFKDCFNILLSECRCTGISMYDGLKDNMFYRINNNNITIEENKEYYNIEKKYYNIEHPFIKEQISISSFDLYTSDSVYHDIDFNIQSDKDNNKAIITIDLNSFKIEENNIQVILTIIDYKYNNIHNPRFSLLSKNTINEKYNTTNITFIFHKK